MIELSGGAGRGWRALGVAVVLALAASIVVVASSGAGAQQEAEAASGGEVSVSNLGETGTTHWCSSRSDWYCAQGFATGSEASGYVLTSVTASFVDKAGSPGDIVATLHASADSTGTDGKRPDAGNGASLATLSGDNPDAAGDYTFTCTGDGCALAANTTYFVRFSATSGSDNDNEYRWKTVLNGFGETPVPSDNGWTLADELDYRPDNTSWTAAADLAAYLKINATTVQQPDEPEPPAEPVVTAERHEDGDAADISWTAYGGDGFSYYRVIVCDDSQYYGVYCDGTVFQSAPIWDASSTGPVTVTGLDAATGYGVILQVWRDGGALKFYATLPAPLVPPAAPTGLSATAGDGTVTLSWDDPSDSSITGYEFNLNHNDTWTGNFSGWGPWTSIANSGASTTTHTISGLTNGREYRYHIRAVNAGGSGHVAPNAHPWFVSAVPQVLGSVSVTDVRVQGNVLSVTWDAVSGASGYDIRTKTGAAGWVVVAEGVSGTAAQVIIGAIPDWTGVRARAGTAVGPWSDVSRMPQSGVAAPGGETAGLAAEGGFGAQSQGGVGAQSPGVPTGISVDRWNTAPSSKRLPGIEPDRLDVSWTNVPGALGYYFACSAYGGYFHWRKCGNNGTDVYNGWKMYRDGNAVNPILESYGPWYSNDGTWLPLSRHSTFTISVHAVNQHGYSPWSPLIDVYPSYAISEVTGRGVPDGYHGLGAVRTTEGFSLWWVHPYGASGYWAECAEVVNGQAGAFTECARNDALMAPLAGATIADRKVSISITGPDSTKPDQKFDPDKTYDIKVYTNNAHGRSTSTHIPFDTLGPLLRVDNLTAGDDLSLSVGSFNSDDRRGAQAFTTGPNSGGYTLTTVTIEAANDSGTPAEFTLGLHAPDPANPANPARTALATLLTRAYPDTAGNHTFTCIGTGCELAPNTTYFITMSAAGSTASNHYNIVATRSDDQTTAPANNGFTIADNGRNWASGNWNDAGMAYRLQVAVLAQPSFDATVVDTASATLTLAGTIYYPILWSFRQTAPAQGPCLAGERDHTQALTNLTPGITYAYTAYGFILCPAGQEIDTATFRTQVTVDNLDKAVHSPSCNISGDTRCAVAFTTGPSLGDYTLTTVRAKFGAKTDPSNALGNIAATLHADSSGVPASASLAALSGSDPDTAGDYTYTCAGTGCTLSRDTTYFIQFAAGSGSEKTEHYKWSTTTSDDQNLVPAGNGWSLADETDYYVSGTGWRSTPYTNTGILRIAATVNQALTAVNVGPTTATLTLVGHTGNWWSKQTAPSDGTCTAGEADFSHALSGLTPDTGHVYRAYADAGCAAEIASVTFTTPNYGDRRPDAEVDITTGLLKDAPLGLWSDGTTVWYSDADNVGNDKLFAHTLSTKVRDAGKDITLHTDNGDPRGIWSDGTAVWVADSGDDKIYAYKMSDGTRDSDKDITLHADNADPGGIWSDKSIPGVVDATIWVVDTADKWIYAYGVTSGVRRPAKEFNTLVAAGNEQPWGIWSDGQTAWVTDTHDQKIYAYRLSDKTRDDSKDYTLHTGNNGPTGIWSNNASMWVADSNKKKIFAYFSLSKLTAGSVGLISASLNLTDHTGNWWIKRTSPSPAGTCTAGESDYSHALSGLTVGTTYTYKAYSKDGCSSADEIAPVTFTTVNYGDRILSEETPITTRSFKDAPLGVWSNSTTIWYSDDSDNKLFAHTLSTKARDLGKDITLDAANGNARGIWSNGAKMWVANNGTSADKIFAYTLATKARDSDKDLTLHADNGSPAGIWSNGDTMWVVDAVDDKIYAYKMSDGTRDSAKDITLHADNTAPWGIHSDHSTMWVSDNVDKKLYGYRVSDKTRETAREYTLYADNGNAHGIWSRGSTMWVADNVDGRIYAYQAWPTLTPNFLTHHSVSLDLANHEGNWWFKRISPTEGTCTQGETDFTHGLLNLTPSTTYTFKAYKRIGCNSADEIASATFTTSSS